MLIRISGRDGPDGEWIPVLDIVAGLVNTARFVAWNKEIIIECKIDIVMRTRLNNIRTINIFRGIG